MAISEETRKNVRRRAGGRCECTMKVCEHRGRCTTGLSSGELHHKTSVAGGGQGTASNLTAMCAACHKN